MAVRCRGGNWSINTFQLTLEDRKGKMINLCTVEIWGKQMSRWIVPKRPALRGKKSAQPGDDAVARIAKYVPAEVLGPFTLLFTILASLQVSSDQRQWAAVGLIVLFLLVTIAYIVMKAPEGEIRKAHLFVSPLAFIVWAYPISSSALGNWFAPLAAFAGQAIVIALSIFIRPVLPES